jgi:hypothetical protein
MIDNIKWMEEIVIDVPSNRFLFKFLRFILGKRKKGITYKELYIFYSNTYNIKGTESSSIKTKAMENVLAIYYYNNKKLPE